MSAFNKEHVHFMADSTLYGSYGYFADSIDRLVHYVTTDYHRYHGRLSSEVSNNCSFPFVNEEDGVNYRFFYHDPRWVNRVVTNRELSQWLAQGNGECARIDGTGHVCNCHTEWSYSPRDEHDRLNANVVVRKWGDASWNDPTALYLGLDK